MGSAKVGLIGWYMHGNFGDDVMAVMIARTLKEHGFRPVVYQLPRRLAQAEDIETVDTVEALADGAIACVLGGGGLLVSGDESLNHALRAFDDELRQLARCCDAHGIPVWAVSIGGNGNGRATKLYPGLARLLGSGVVRGVTTRLVRDGALLDAFDIPWTQHPDIVFLAPEFWPVATNVTPRNIVVTNRIASSFPGRALTHGLDACGSWLGVETWHAATRHVSVCDEDERPAGRRSRHAIYTDVQGFANLFSRTRAVISSKLHLGIFAMAYGAVFLSYGGKTKTRAQLQELGLESRIVTAASLPRWVGRLRSGMLAELDDTAALVADSRTGARGHLTALVDFLKPCAADESRASGRSWPRPVRSS
jgi:hypothetical protein